MEARSDRISEASLIHHPAFQRLICPDGEQASGHSGPSWCPDDDLASEPIIRGPH